MNGNTIGKDRTTNDHRIIRKVFRVKPGRAKDKISTISILTHRNVTFILHSKSEDISLFVALPVRKRFYTPSSIQNSYLVCGILVIINEPLRDRHAFIKSLSVDGALRHYHLRTGS